MARILWVSTELPERHGQGGQRRQFHQISALARRGHEIEVIVPRSEQTGTSIEQVATLRRPRITRLRRLSRALVRRLRAELAADPADAIVVSHTESAWLLPEPGDLVTPVVIDVHNVLSHWHDQNDRAAEAAAARAAEAAVLDRVTAAMTCSHVETERLRAIHPAIAATVFTAPLGVDPGEWPPREFSREQPIVAMFGSWAWEPNREGLRWFLDAVWPGVAERVPGAQALVAGNGVDDAAAWPSGARFVGRVADPSEFTAQATVVAVPVLHGVGASVKFAESLASGAAVIATEDGANAFDDPPAFVSADAHAWVDWIALRLAHRQEEPVPAASRAIALHDYTWDAAVAPIDAWLASFSHTHADDTSSGIR